LTKKPPPTVVERIDAALHTLNHSASGLQTGGVEDQVSRRLAKELLRARETAETLQGFLRQGDV
jgi:hypothetical protein